ncbi:hypothetical protein BEP19_09835 [Ammoniphilus oxalaticus]|uniref:Phage protein n=1 Tax=Ammoniphilus oxalaticus TaxID=66863 RepID=A0A419SFI9_9BACL|nr:hypothetical protein [Ammoniphilus oxalaticus]RKD22552.1 hypothetical protein BEP19_09835 [Ammoniphilus oxalaticus]
MIRSIMEKATKAVEFMYDRKATIIRHMEYEKPSRATGVDWVPVHEDIPCRLSNPNLNNTLQGDANVIQYDTKMFLSSDYEILAGDRVVVDSVSYESAKEPFVYVSHQEVLLLRKGYA